MATGAFPIFLAPRILSRNLSEFTPPMWESVTAAATGNPPPVSPSFPPGTPDPLPTLNVDGGVTNNDPFIYAHDYLARMDPPVDRERMTVCAKDVDRLVINVAPFPTKNAFDVTDGAVKASDVFSIVGKLYTALISQSRFFGEALTKVMNGTTFDLYVIAPSDEELVDSYKGKKPEDTPPALQCATLGAFGGFFYRGFRAHDYALGRRNCQKFLQKWFALPQDNLVIEGGLPSEAAERSAMVEKFGVPPPPPYKAAANQVTPSCATDDLKWIPVIPLCGKAADAIAPIARVAMNGKMLDDIVDLIMQRFKEVVATVLSNIQSRSLRWFLQVGQPFIRVLARSPLRAVLIKGLGDSYRP
jgi:hypothetical protein